MAVDNKSLGRFDLVGIPSAPRGVPQIEVTFDIDANGIVNVSAKDLGTGKEQKIRIESSSGISKDDVEKLVREAESHSEEDKKKQELVQTRNNLDNLIYQIEKNIKEYGDKISSNEKEQVEGALKSAKEALKSDQVEILKQATEKLTTASHAIAQKMYEAAAKQKAGESAKSTSEPSGGSKKSEGEKTNVVDADYEVVDGEEDEKRKK